jgi:hypothetical protein
MPSMPTFLWVIIGSCASLQVAVGTVSGVAGAPQGVVVSGFGLCQIFGQK